jgi:hypothetical protein
MSVDAVTDLDIVLVRLDMHVAGAGINGVGQQLVDELDEGRVVVIFDVGDVQDLVVLDHFIIDGADIDVLDRVLEDVVDRVLRLVIFMDVRHQLRMTAQDRLDVQMGDKTNLIARHDIARITHGRQEHVPFFLKRQDTMVHGPFERQKLDETEINIDPA